MKQCERGKKIPTLEARHVLTFFSLRRVSFVFLLLSTLLCVFSILHLEGDNNGNPDKLVELRVPPLCTLQLVTLAVNQKKKIRIRDWRESVAIVLYVM